MIEGNTDPGQRLCQIHTQQQTHDENQVLIHQLQERKLQSSYNKLIEHINRPHTS